MTRKVKVLWTEHTTYEWTLDIDEETNLNSLYDVQDTLDEAEAWDQLSADDWSRALKEVTLREVLEVEPSDA